MSAHRTASTTPSRRTSHRDSGVAALRLHVLSKPDEKRKFVDIDPVHDSLVFFPSWLPHEVLPVSCPSRRFMDSRFAIHCWFDGAIK